MFLVSTPTCSYTGRPKVMSHIVLELLKLKVVGLVVHIRFSGYGRMDTFRSRGPQGMGKGKGENDCTSPSHIFIHDATQLQSNASVTVPTTTSYAW